MNSKDKALFIVVLVGLIAVMSMAVSNIYSNLMASGTVVFLENPWLALALSALLPAGSVALKFVTNFMDFDASRKRYAIFINILMALALLLYSILFALNFTGVAGGIDWNSLGEESHQGGAFFTWTQVVAEMLVGTSLSLVLEDIWSKYYTEKLIENPDYIAANSVYLTHKAVHEKLSEKRNKVYGRIAELEAAKHVFIDEKTARFISMRAKFGAFQNFH